MQQALPNGLLEASYKLAVQVGVGQTVLHILHSRLAVRVVNHNVKHLCRAQLPHCLIHIVVQPALPLLQAALALFLDKACSTSTNRLGITSMSNELVTLLTTMRSTAQRRN